MQSDDTDTPQPTHPLPRITNSSDLTPVCSAALATPEADAVSTPSAPASDHTAATTSRPGPLHPGPPIFDAAWTAHLLATFNANFSTRESYEHVRAIVDHQKTHGDADEALSTAIFLVQTLMILMHQRPDLSLATFREEIVIGMSRQRADRTLWFHCVDIQDPVIKDARTRAFGPW
nr:hypothetical protein B0A51_05802 [Rachicladosporium sp. CCFEE 5018]